VEHHGQHDGESHEQEGPRRTASPGHGGARQLGAGSRNPDQPRRRKPGEPRQPLAERQADRCHEGGCHTEHRGGSHRRNRKQVGRDGEQPELSGQGDDDRAADHLRRSRDGDGVGQPGRQVTGEPLTPTRSEHEQSGGREHRQREAGRHGQVGRGEHEDDHRRGERRQGAAPAAGAQGEQRERAHDGRAQHARRRPRQHREGHERESGRHRPNPQRDPQPSAEQQHGPEQDGDVGARQCRCEGCGRGARRRERTLNVGRRRQVAGRDGSVSGGGQRDSEY